MKGVKAKKPLKIFANCMNMAAFINFLEKKIIFYIYITVEDL